MKPSQYDAIIVGAGSAGCVVARRLVEGNRSVLLLEAGPKDRSIILQMPAALGLPLTSKKYNWGFVSEPNPGLGGRTSDQHRGRVLGGSSTINGMVFVRGNPRDFDSWAALGLPDWSYLDCLPYFKRMETFEGGANAYRGANGPLHVQRCKMENPLYSAFLSAGQAFGLSFNEDPNGGFQEGVNVAQASIQGGVRQSTSVAFLNPVIGRSNLTVETGALVSGLQISGNRVEGVTYVSGGRTVTAIANEVILSAGAYGTPQLLMLSGIGDPDHLNAIGVKPRVRLPGVGQNLQDHTAVPLQYTTKKALSPIRQFSSVGRLVTGARWILSKGGGGRSNYFEVGAFFKGDDGAPFVNMQHEFCPMIAGFDHGGHDIHHGFQYFTSVMRPRSRGRVTLRSHDPNAAPIIDLNLLGDPGDMTEILAGVRRTREIIRQRPWQDLGAAAHGVTADETDGSGLERWIRSVAGTGYHPVGTCRMGSDDMAVTDSDGRVHGVEGLRIVDSSLMPRVVTGNTNAATIMIGEKLADRILGRRLPRADVMYEGRPAQAQNAAKATH